MDRFESDFANSLAYLAQVLDQDFTIKRLHEAAPELRKALDTALIAADALIARGGWVAPEITSPWMREHYEYDSDGLLAVKPGHQALIEATPGYPFYVIEPISECQAAK